MYHLPQLAISSRLPTSPNAMCAFDGERVGDWGARVRKKGERGTLWGPSWQVDTVSGKLKYATAGLTARWQTDTPALPNGAGKRSEQNRIPLHADIPSSSSSQPQPAKCSTMSHSWNWEHCSANTWPNSAWFICVWAFCLAFCPNADTLEAHQTLIWVRSDSVN